MKMFFNAEKIASDGKGVLTHQICCHSPSSPSYYPKSPLTTSIRQGMRMVKMSLFLHHLKDTTQKHHYVIFFIQ